jgi:phosphate butyryltransferase
MPESGEAMLSSFRQLLDIAKDRGPIRVAVAAAQDPEVMEAIQSGIQANLIEAILVGDSAIVGPMAEELGILGQVQIIHEPDETKASLLAAGCVRDGEAQVLMKGLVNSSTFLRAALDPERGLRSGRLLSHLVAMEIPGAPKLSFFTDGGMNIAPNFDEKKQILTNALEAMIQMGVEVPRVAVLCANEQVSPKMQATVDAKALVEAWEAGAFPDCIVEGPIAMDVALSPLAAQHKGLRSRVSGEVDLFLMPNIESGNMVTKVLLHYTASKFAGVIVGASHPIVMVSRSNTAEDKLNAIAMAALVCHPA